MDTVVLVTFSDSFARPGSVAAVSASDHLPPGIPMVIASTDLSARSKRLIGSHLDERGRPHRFVDAGSVVDSLPAVSRYVADTWIRVFVDEILPIEVQRVLYLDADTMTVGSLDLLLDLDLDRYPLAALADPVFQTFGGRGQGFAAGAGVAASTRYLNTGVLVIDRPSWRIHGIAAAVRTMVASGAVPLDYVDQDALNAVVVGEWLPLDARLHRLVEPALPPPGDEDVVLHFTGTPKPWEVPVPPTPWHERYRDFARSLGWVW